MTDSISGAGSVVSEQYVPTNRGFPGSPGSGYFPPPVPMQQPERTMVLSMNFVDPQTGQRGTYTGQVNSMSHKPDGKGTVYYSNGSIAEGTWSNGVLAQDESSQERHPNYAEENQHRAAGGRPAPPSHHYSQRETSAEPSSRSSRSRSVSHHQSGQPRSRSRGPAAQSVDPPIARNPPPNAHPSPSMMMGGNLDRLESLGGNRRRTRGASASVQSFNSRTSRTSQFGSQSVAGGHYNTSSSVAPMHPSSFHGDPPLQGQNYQNPVSSYYNNLRPSPPMGNSRRGQFEG